MNGQRRCGTYTQWNITQTWKEQSNVLCNHVKGPRDCHTERKSDGDGQISYAITFMCKL